MAVSSGFAEMLADVLAPLGRVTVRRMFGGGGVYCDGAMFGLVVDDALFVKADAASQAAFEAEGCGPLVYHGKGKPIAMSYWRIPDRLLDEPDELMAWARVALGIARRGAATRKKDPKAGKPTKSAGGAGQKPRRTPR